MKKTWAVFILIVILFSNQANPTDVKQAEEIISTEKIKIPPFATHALLIFLDDSEKEIERISSDVIPALFQKAAPLLISTHLLHNVIGDQTLEQLAETNEEFQQYKNFYELILKKLRDLIPNGPLDKEQQAITLKLNQEIPKAPNIFGKAAKAIMRKRIGFNPDEWIIKSVTNTNNALLLLVPKSYVPVYSMPMHIEPKGFTQHELGLGLKIDHLDTISSQQLDIILKSAKPQQNQDYFAQGIWNTETPQSNVFITRKEYSERNIATDAMPQWIFYMAGHGISKKKIAGLSVPTFINWLDFLETKLCTKLIFYWTCYAAGENLNLVFKQARSSIEKTYSYAIVTGAATDSVLFSPGGELQVTDLGNFSPEDINFTSKTLIIRQLINFKNFVAQATGSDTVDFLNLFNVLYPAPRILKEAVAEEILLFRRMAQIKLPGIEWFRLLDEKGVQVSLGKRFCLAHNSNIPISIAQFFKKQHIPSNPRIILLYSHIVPFELIIDTKNLPAFASMIAGDSIHILEKIRLPEGALFNEFIKKFEWPYDHPRKIFWIKNISSKGLFSPSVSELAELNSQLSTIAESIRKLKGQAIWAEDQKPFAEKIANLEAQEKTLNKQLTEKSNPVLKDVDLKDLIIDLQRSQPKVFYSLNSKFFEIELDSKTSGIHEKQVADYMKDYRALIDSSREVQAELRQQQEFEVLNKMLEQRVKAIKEKR